jgi:hypothetical protein
MKRPEVTFYDVRELEKGMCFSIEKARRLGYHPVGSKMTVLGWRWMEG